MTRLQKKCLIGSAFFHGLTVAVFVVTAAFRTAPALTEDQVLHFIPAKILDDPGVGGQPAPAIVNPQPSPPAIQPAPPKPQPQPAPVAPPKTVATTPPKPSEAKPAAPKPGPTPTPAKRPIKVDLSDGAPSTRTPSRNSEAAAQARAAEQAANNKQLQQEIAAAFAALDSSVRSKETPVSVVPLPGEGGGEAFVNYRTAVFNAYYQAWKTPEGTTRRLAVADVKIVVARNGDIISSEFVSKSGDPPVDQSVQRALDQVERQKLPPFPAGAEDTQRTFILRFNLEAKQSAG